MACFKHLQNYFLHIAECLSSYIFFFLEYAGELRIIVLKGEEESYIDSHPDTLKTHTKTHTPTHVQEHLCSETRAVEA